MQTTFFDPIKLETAEFLDRGLDLMVQNHYAEALVQFENVLRLNPNDRYALWNRSVILLSMGDYVNGMPDSTWTWVYDWHALSLGEKNLDRFLTLPVWHGEPCRLLAYNETGFGDAIMLLRFLPELAKRNKNVTMVVRPELAKLMRGYGAKVLDHVPGDMTEFDARITFYSLLSVLGHTIETIPNNPYIFPDFWVTETGKCSVGIAWSGNSRRELTLDSFLSKFDCVGIDLYALQLADMEESTGRIERLIHPLPSKDFVDTANLIARMDHIVTVDTAAAHLAGAMGHPSVHLLLPFMRDWRWWNKDVWYPTINIYPQDNPDDWDAPFERVNAAIRGD